LSKKTDGSFFFLNGTTETATHSLRTDKHAQEESIVRTVLCYIVQHVGGQSLRKQKHKI